jgi:hypothetical protein
MHLLTILDLTIVRLSEMVVEYIIEKVPLASRPADIPKNFPRLPQLYLEFLENKAKVKPNLANKEYTPPELSDDEKNYELPPQRAEDPVYVDNSDSEEFNEKENIPLKEEAEIASVKASSEKQVQTESEVARRIDNLERVSRSGEEADADADSDTSSIASFHSAVSKKSRPGSSRSAKNRLLNILGKGKQQVADEEVVVQPRVAKVATPRIDRKLPTLKELEQQNIVKRDKVIIDAERIKDNDEDKKRDLLLKFDLLKRTYPRAHIPKVSIHEDYASLERQYEDTLHNLSIENSVDNYKQYMTFLFMGIEWFLGKVFKMDMKGYTDHQLEQMHRYEKFLVQIGEKNYIPTKKSWPVEIQLLISILVQTALFVLMRSIFNGAGASVLRTVNEARMPNPLSSMNGNVPPAQPTTVPATAQVKKPERKMRGPSINLDDLPEVKS